MSLSDIKDLTKEDVLGAIGLSVKRSTSDRVLTALGFFGLGLLVGSATALLLAPQSGKGLREDVSNKLNRLRNGEGVSSVTAERMPSAQEAGA
jgi:YtxH-like protein